MSGSSGNEQDSPSGSDEPESENSDSSSSDFEIQAVTTADGIRTEASNEESGESSENEKLQSESEPGSKNDVAPRENNINVLGLNAYSDSSSSEEDPGPSSTPNAALKSALKQTPSGVRTKKRVRFAEDPPEKKRRLKQTNGQMNVLANGHIERTASDEADEVAILTELAEFEAAVADAGRDADDIETDLADAEDAREEAEQNELEERVKQLREAIMRRKLQVKSGDVNESEDESSTSSDEESDDGAKESLGILAALGSS